MLKTFYEYIEQSNFNEAIAYFQQHHIGRCLLKELTVEEREKLLRQIISNGIHAQGSHLSSVTKLISELVTKQYMNLHTQLMDYSYEHLKLLQQAEVLNYCKNAGNSLIHLVALRPSRFDSHVKAMELAISESGLNFKCANDKFENTVFHELIANELYDRLTALLQIASRYQYNIDFSLKDIEGKTALLLAAKMRDYEVIEQLLYWPSAQANIDNPDNTGKTALHYACLLGHPKMAQKLIEHGSSTQTKDKLGCTPLMYTFASTDQIKQTLKSVAIDPDRPNNVRSDTFQDDCYQPFIDIDTREVLKIPKRNNDLTRQKIRDIQGRRLISSNDLLVGLLRYHPDNTPIINQLLEQTKQFSPTSITQHIINAHYATIDTVLSADHALGAWLLRYCASDQSKTETLQYLLNNWSQAIDINEAGIKTGMTALHQAVNNQNHKAVIELIKAGVDISKKDNKHGKTPFEIDQGVIVHWALRYLTSQVADLSLLNKLVQHQSVNLNAQGPKSGRTALHQAVIARHYQAITMFAREKADPNLSDHQGNTPLHLCAQNGDLQALDALIEADSELNPDIRNQQHQSVWDLLDHLTGDKARCRDTFKSKLQAHMTHTKQQEHRTISAQQFWPERGTTQNENKFTPAPGKNQKL